MMRLRYLIDEIKKVPAWKDVEGFLSGEEPSLRVGNLYGASKTVLLAAVLEAVEQPVTVITPDNSAAERITIDLHQFRPPGEIFYFPPSSGSTIERELPVKETMGRRMEALRALADGRRAATVIPGPCLLDEMMAPGELLDLVLKVSHGETEGRDRLIERLLALGYRREYVVEEVGVFAVRGGVLDVYGFGMDAPVRMEFFGDELVSMRGFDIQTQRSQVEIRSLQILPMVERKQSAGSSPLFTYLPRDGWVVLVEGAAVKSNLEGVRFPGEVAEHPPAETAQRCFEVLGERKRLFLESLHVHGAVDPFAGPLAGGSEDAGAGAGSGRVAGRSVRFGTHEPERIDRDIGKLREVVRREEGARGKTVILCDNYGQKERIGELLGDLASACTLEVGGLETGFQIPDARLTLYNDHEIFRRPRLLRYRRRYRRGVGLDSLDSITLGDYLVHVDYGIGRFEGLKVIRLHAGEVECLAIRYKGGDRVYVPVEKLDLVDKYRGADGAPPRIDQLGGKGWE
jgi:transcription-repair coupling factor (superfamily II helicase)